MPSRSVASSIAMLPASERIVLGEELAGIDARGRTPIAPAAAGPGRPCGWAGSGCRAGRSSCRVRRPCGRSPGSRRIPSARRPPRPSCPASAPPEQRPASPAGSNRHWCIHTARRRCRRRGSRGAATRRPTASRSPAFFLRSSLMYAAMRWSFGHTDSSHALSCVSCAWRTQVQSTMPFSFQ